MVIRCGTTFTVKHEVETHALSSVIDFLKKLLDCHSVRHCNFRIVINLESGQEEK